MGRWQPDARGRLAQAAIELYADAGYEETTVADIAARAGLTERTFFRYFADKREVLFDGSRDLEGRVRAAVAAAPEQASPLQAVVGAFADAAALFDGRRDSARRRAATITANPSLQERDLLKLERLGEAVGDALRQRGVPGPSAALAAGAGMTVFREAFGRWLTGSAPDLAASIHDTFHELQAQLVDTAA